MEQVVIFPNEVAKALKDPQDADHELLLDIGVTLLTMTQKQQRFLGLYAMGYTAEEIGDIVEIQNPQVALQRAIHRVTTLINLKSGEKK